MRLKTEKPIPEEAHRQSDTLYIGGSSGSTWNEREMMGFAQP